MALDIRYRELTTYYPRRVKKIEARLGDLWATGKNKSEARAELERLIEAHCERVYTRRYLVGELAVFCLYPIIDSWAYDIIPIGVAGEIRTSSCGLNKEMYPYESSALAAMRRHWEQYHNYPLHTADVLHDPEITPTIAGNDQTRAS